MNTYETLVKFILASDALLGAVQKDTTFEQTEKQRLSFSVEEARDLALQRIGVDRHRA